MGYNASEVKLLDGWKLVLAGMKDGSGNAYNVTVRPYCAEDDAFLFELYVAVRAGDFAALNRERAELEPLLRMQFAAQARSYAARFPRANHGIICEKGLRIGRVIIDESDEEIRLVDIALLPPCRNRGIGAFLVRDLQSRAAAAKKPVRLHVAKGNPAVHLYTRLGFVATGDVGAYIMMEWRPAG